jgi:hypothetical protein
VGHDSIGREAPLLAAEGLRWWVRQAARDAHLRPGLTKTEREELKRLQREDVDLKRAKSCARRRRCSHRRSSTAERSDGDLHRSAPGNLRSRADLRGAAEVFVRRIVGWWVSPSLAPNFVLDSLEQAIYDRCGEDVADLVHHSGGRGTYRCTIPNGWAKKYRCSGPKDGGACTGNGAANQLLEVVV